LRNYPAGTDVTETETTSSSDDLIAPPAPNADQYTEFFWRGAREGKLLILRCQECGNYIHLPRPICRRCLSFNVSPEEVSGLGNIYSYTVTVRPFHPFYVARVPYVVAAIELVEQGGLRVIANLVHPEGSDISIGMPVKVAFERLSADVTVPVFYPTPVDPA
jgi:uncharacterized OB-fold protein